MSNFYIPLYPGGIFHVLSHAVGNELLFRNDENYRFFLQKYNSYINPIADTYCYALMPNHFHFMIRIKEETAIRTYFQNKKPGKELNDMPEFIMNCFSNFLNSYAKSYNKVYKRKGALFVDYLRRVEVKNDAQFGSTIFYIHKNPVHHGFCKNISGWNWTSYQSIFSKSPTLLLREDVLDWFGGLEQFIQFHNQPIFLKGAAELE